MKDELFMSTETGELASGNEAIRLFYKDHTAFEDWRSEWVSTGEETETEIPFPDFTKTLNLY